MLRSELINSGELGLDHDPNFRWRGKAVTRIENLSDIVFALALGMLITTADPLRTFDDLNLFLVSAAPVALGFIILLQIWHNHFTFFRRYGVADRYIIILNAILLFIIMYLAYPLKIMFDGLFSYFLGFFDGYARMGKLQVNFPRSGQLVGYFALGFTVINSIFTLMYRHVLARKVQLALSETELILTRKSYMLHIFMISICLIVAGLSLLTPLYSIGSLAFALQAPLVIWLRHRYRVSSDQN